MIELAPLILTAALVAVDGDTVKNTSTGERLRLEHIDAPERGHRAACLEEAALAARAHARLTEILAAGVVVEWGGDRGGWQRRLVVLRLPDGRTAGDLLILDGLAVPWVGKRHDWCAD